MGPRLGSPTPKAHLYTNRTHYWRTRRGITSITLVVLGLFFVFQSLRSPAPAIRQPVYSAFGGTAGSGAGSRSSRVAGSFGGWRGWRAPVDQTHQLQAAADKDHGWSGPAAPLQSGLRDFDHPPTHKAADGDRQLLNPNLFPTRQKEAEKKKQEEEEKRKQKEEEDRRKQEQQGLLSEGEEDKKKKEEEERKKKEEADRKKKEEEDRMKKEEEKKKEEKTEQKPIDSSNKSEEEKKQQEAERKKKEEEEEQRRKKEEEEAKKKASENKEGDKGEAKTPSNLTATVVVGRLKDDLDGVKWIDELLRDITHSRIYIVDDPEAPLHLKHNKGRESMVYLRYIMDFYDDLDDVTFFFHSSRRAWHNNALLGRDAAVMINNLQRPWIVEKGYMNARCELYPGCPQWIKWNASPTETRIHYERNSDLFSKELWDTLFPDRDHDPVFLSQPCCSQFAVSKEKIQSIPLAQYQRLHDWLGTTDTDDGFSGRIMEYTWQYLFLNQDEHCPDMHECYCKGYGLCLSEDHYEDLKIYNELRGEIDDTLEKLSKWNVAKGCPKFEEDSKEREECKADNPWWTPLVAVRQKKMTLEREMPKQWGIMVP